MTFGIVDAEAGRSADALDEGELASVLARLGVEQHYKNVVKFTRQLFPGRLDVSVDEDPETAGDLRIVLTVGASDNFDQVLEKESQWCTQLLELGIPTATVFRLSII